MRTAEPGLDLTADLAAGARQDWRWRSEPWSEAFFRTPAEGCRRGRRHSVAILDPGTRRGCTRGDRTGLRNAYIDEPHADRTAASRRLDRAAARIAATDPTVRRILIRFGLVGAGMAAFEILIRFDSMRSPDPHRRRRRSTP